MMQSIFIPFLLPNLNDMIEASKKRKGNWSNYADKKREIQGQIGLYLSYLDPVRSEVYIKFYWVEKERRRDPDNISAGKKYILDALVQKGILQNDGWKDIAGFSDEFFIDKNNPGVRVEIYEV